MGVTPLLSLFSFSFGCILCPAASTHHFRGVSQDSPFALGHCMSPGRRIVPVSQDEQAKLSWLK